MYTSVTGSLPDLSVGGLSIKYKKLNNFYFKNILTRENVSGYVCNHGSPNGERDTASPRGRYGERPQRDSCLKIHM